MEEKRFTADLASDAHEAVLRHLYVPKKLEQKLIIPENISADSQESVDDDILQNLQSSMYSDNDVKRFLDEKNDEKELAELHYRTPFRRDYARIIHSPSFRRLQGKTQLYPCTESDFFRNRLTHSMEVAQIAKTIALKLNATNEDLKNRPKCAIDLDLIEIAGLAHDLGHPPFGHQGEAALNKLMATMGGFEGNAQTLRLLSRIEKKRQSGNLELGGFDDLGVDWRYGLNLTYRSLASILKYDNEMPEETTSVVKGYYKSEKELVRTIKHFVTGGKSLKGKKFKTIECSIMDLADDIAYSTFDIEDAFKGGFIHPFDIMNFNKEFYESVCKKVNEELKEKNLNIKPVEPKKIRFIVTDLFKELFNVEWLIGLKELGKDLFSKEDFNYLVVQYADKFANYLVHDGYTRTSFSSKLVSEAVGSVTLKFNHDIPALSTVEMHPDTLIRIEILKQVAFTTQILSPKLQIAEFRGGEIIEKIFNALKLKPSLLPLDIYQIYKSQKSENIEVDQCRVICDYIACMTDKYAIELYGRLTSETPATIFKPY